MHEDERSEPGAPDGAGPAAVLSAFRDRKADFGELPLGIPPT